MQSFILLTMLVLMSGCTAMVLGGGAAGNSQTTVTSTTDATISARVRSQLAADTALSAFDFSVRSHSGAVTLGGSVDSHIARGAGCSCCEGDRRCPVGDESDSCRIE